MKRGDPITYFSLASELWPAVVIGTKPDGSVDIEVEGLVLTRVPLYAGTDLTACPPRSCLAPGTE